MHVLISLALQTLYPKSREKECPNPFLQCGGLSSREYHCVQRHDHSKGPATLIPQKKKNGLV